MFSKVSKLNNAHAPVNRFIPGIWACSCTVNSSVDRLMMFCCIQYYGATTLGVFILRKNASRAETDKVWGYPVVQL
jgi:hypothetical protein